MKYHVRNYEDIDRKSLSLLVTECEDFWGWVEVSKSLESSNNEMLVLLDDDHPVGYCFYSVVGDSSDLIHCFILVEKRGLGLSKLLLKTYIDHCLRQDVTNFLLEVRESNKVARSLYQSVGYKLIDQRPSYYKDGETALIMQIGSQGD